MKKVVSFLLFFLAYYNQGYAQQSVLINSIKSYAVNILNTKNLPDSKQIITANTALLAPPLASSNSPVCEGNVLKLSASNGTTFTWTGPNSFSSNLQNPILSNVNLSATGIYSVTIVEANGFKDIVTINVTINALPVPTITADYCAIPGKIQLTAGGGDTYLWNTLETTPSISINIAGTYSVTVTDLAGCTAFTSFPVATELVTDGSFTNFNASTPSFTSTYIQNQGFYTGTSGSGLVPEGKYAVNTSAWSNYPGAPDGYHQNFHGRDHTNNAVGQRNFMMVNGSGSPITVWQQIVTVLPNTDYYFSAWGMNLNPVSPASLQFEINGVPMGTIADLKSAPIPADEGSVNLGNWIQFYSNPLWNSGLATTAIIRIINLNTIKNGNDFGIDDISFGQLAPIPFTISPTTNGLTTATVCKGQEIDLATNINGGRAPINYSWTGPNSYNSNLPDPIILKASTTDAGEYKIVVTDGYGCNPVIGTVTVIVSPDADAGTISGLSPLCIGMATKYITDGDAGGWWTSASPSIAMVDASGVVTAVSVGTTLITYTVNGCGSNLSTSKYITVSPDAKAGRISGLSPICIFKKTIYTSDGDGGGVWTSASPSVATVDTLSGIVTTINGGTSLIKYTVSGCGSNLSATKIVKVSPQSNAGILSGASPICMSATAIYTTNGDAGGAWNSTSPSVATIDPVTGLITAIGAGTSIITYSVSNVNNCNSSVSKAIVVNELPVASFNSSLVQLCESSLPILDSNIIKLNKYVNTSQYQWYINDSLIALSNYFPSYIIHKKDDLVTIKLKTISLFGCNSDSISKLINLIHPPKPSFGLSDTLGCGPLTVSFNNTTSSTAYQYHWNFGNGSSSVVAQPANVTYNYAASGSDTTYTISLTAYSQCDTVTISKKIVVNRKAKVDFNATPTIGCSPIKVLFTNNSIGEITTYRLWFGDGTDSLLTTASINHNYYTGVNTIYNAKLVAVNACGSDSVSIPITGTPNTLKPAIHAKDSILCGSPKTVTFNNTTTGANQFNWDFGDGKTSASLKSPDSISHVYTKNGSYVVRIFISNGCSDTVILRNIYLYSIPAIDFNAVHQSVCMGDSIHFNALTNLGSSFLWRFGDGSSSNQNNPVYAYKNSGIYTVLLKVANANNTCYDSITKPIEIVASLQGYMQVSDTVIKCVPFTVTFTNRSTPSVSTKWNFGDSSNADGDTVTHIFTSNGNYQVTMLSTSPGGCKFADTSNIKVASPVGSLVYNTNIICTKDPVEFESITTNVDSIRWDFGDGTTLTSPADNRLVYHTYSQAGIYLPKARIIGSAGCSVLKDRGDTIKIEQVVASYKLAVSYDCGKTTFNFMDSSHSLFGISNWNWNIGPSSFSNQKNIAQVYSQAGVYPVALIVTGNTGCRDTVKSNMQVAIYQYPRVNISGIAAVCKESLINLKSQVVSIDSIQSLLWDLGNGFSSKDSSVQILYNASGSYQVKLTVNTVNKCYDSAYKQLTIYSAPNISLNRTNTICRGSSINLVASGALNYIWKDQNDSIVCNGCNSMNVTPLNNVQYKVIGYNLYGCSKIDSAGINVIQPFLIAVSPGDSICIGSEKKLSANGASTYSWYPENTLNNCTSATVYASPLVTTTYQVIGKDKNKCFADTSHVTVIVGNPSLLDIGRDTIMQSGSTYTFNPVLPSADIIKWSWSGITNSSCNNCPNPQAKVVYDVCVSCTITNSYNCLTSDTLCIKTFCPEAEVFVPNAFTPDGDGINDKLMVQGKGIKLIKSYRIFNRWGEMVFERTNFSPGDPAYAWDGKIRGKLASPDIFVYICEAICDKGYSSIFKGNVGIIK